MGTAQHSVVIAASPEAVWAVYADPTRIPEWQTGSPVVQDVVGTAGQVGSSYVSRRGRLVATTTVVASAAPNRLVTETDAYLGLRFRVESLLAPAEGGTRLVLHVETAWPRGVGLVGRLVELAVLSDREAAKELRNLAGLVEHAAI